MVGLAFKGFGSGFESIFNPVVAFFQQVSPVTVAVGITALSAATVFVAADFVRTVDDSRGRLQQVAHAVAADVSALSESQAGFVATAQVREAPQPPPEVDAEAIAGVWQRGAGAFAAAFLAIGVAYRRRKPVPAEITAVAEVQPVVASAGRSDYADLLGTIPLGVACWTAAGEMMACNDQFRTRLALEESGATPNSSYQQSVRRLAHGGYLRVVAEDEQRRTLELHREDGSCLLIDERPLSEGGFVTLVTDITEARRTDDLLAAIQEEQRQLARRYHEEKLRAEAASRSKTSFLAHLSHDIRTPLNHIIGFADMMRHQTYGPLGDARYVTYVDGIRGSGEKLLSFFGSILDLAELEGGRREMRRDAFSADELLEATARRFRAQAARAGIGLLVGAPTDALLSGDRFCLERMLGNLVENAIRFTPAGGRISLNAYAAADGIVLEITDTGIGMSAARLDAVSQPFAFGDAAFTREHGGAGLGIAIARAIAMQSGGRLAIDSRQGLGTTVAVSLPLTAADKSEAAE